MSHAVSTRLYLARHADVENPGRILYGHLAGFGLSELGRRQATEMGRYLREHGVRRVVASPLQRAQETARRISAEIEPVPAIETAAELVEARFGLHLQGVQPRQVPWRRPLWLIHAAWPGLLPFDESVAGMAGRVRAVAERVLTEHPGETSVLVSHGDPVQAFWIEAEGRSRYALHRLNCLKGGMLELEYQGLWLVSLRYLPPQVTGVEAAPSTARHSSHT